MGLLPVYKDDVLQDGAFIHALPFCLTHCNSEKCKNHYALMSKSKPGFYTCPYGLSTLVQINGGECFCFSCLHERKSYSKKKAGITRAESKIYNPVLDAEELFSLAKRDIETITANKEYCDRISEVNDLLHETRKLNGEIKTICDIIWENAPSDDQYDTIELIEKLRNIHTYSFIVYNRFLYYDTVVNPALNSGAPYTAVVFKKFDKMRKVLRGYNRKNVWISLDSQSTFSYKIYPSFETLLFILLENGIKYSPDNKAINISFLQLSDNCLDVTIKSIGPFCHSTELPFLGTKGFRGEQAKLKDKSGQGIGLNFAKRICDLHHIDISFNSSYGYKDHGIVYGTFEICLHFDRTRI